MSRANVRTESTKPVQGSPQDMDVEESKEPLASKEGLNTNQICVVTHSVKVKESNTVYICDFNLKPEMLKYYYNPGPEAYADGKPVLINSPEFSGGFETKWCLSVTFNRWIGQERWVSLYLTRVDNGSADELSLSFVLKVIDLNGKVLFSRANAGVLEDISAFEGHGYTKFFPFCNMPSVIVNDTCFRVEAELTLFQHRGPHQKFLPEGGVDSQVEELDKTLSVPEEPEAKSDKAEVVAETLAGPSFQAVSFGLRAIKPGQIALCVKNVPCSFLYLQDLIAKNIVFESCTTRVVKERIVVGIPDICEDINWTRETVKEFAQYIQTGTCGLLTNGIYEDIYLLLKLAALLNAEELMSQCLTKMTLKCSTETAAVQVYMLEKYKDVVEVDTDIKASFKEMFKHNYGSIRLTEGYKRLAPTYSKQFTDLAFAPSCFN